MALKNKSRIKKKPVKKRRLTIEEFAAKKVAEMNEILARLGPMEKW